MNTLKRDFLKGVGKKLKQIGSQLLDVPPSDDVPEVGELDELETFIGSKKLEAQSLLEK